jgi:hypothetical protein
MNGSASLTLIVLVVFFVFITLPALAQETSKLPYMNPKLSPEERAADLVRRMTRECPASAENGESVPRLR